MMNKKIFYIIASIAVLIILGMLYVLFSMDTPQAQIAIPTIDGQSVEVKDFTKTSQRNDEAALTLTDQPEVAVIMYNENSGIFTILLHANEQEEFDAKRPLAEAQFLEQLGVTQAEACRLQVEVATDGPETDLLEFTKPQKLSFCQ